MHQGVSAPTVLPPRLVFRCVDEKCRLGILTKVLYLCHNCFAMGSYADSIFVLVVYSLIS